MQSAFSASICDHPGVVTVKEEDYVEVPPDAPPVQRQKTGPLDIDPPIKLEPLPAPPPNPLLEEDFTAIFFTVGVLTGVLATLFVFSHRFSVE